MHTVFYGIAGEGLGHASRVQSIVEALDDCRVHIFTHGDAYRYLSKQGYPDLYQIEGLEYAFHRGRVSLPKSIVKNLHFIMEGVYAYVENVLTYADMFKPKLFITDYEPVTCRAAKRLNIPCISIDNQHAFSHCTQYRIPVADRIHVKAMGSYGNCLIPYKDEVVVSTFHPELLTVKPGKQNVHITHGIIRKTVREQEVRNDGHGLLYIRKPIYQQAMLRSIQGLDMPIKVYGARPDDATVCTPNVTFHSLGPEFVQDMATCDWVMGTAGHQLLSEARYLGKRMLIIPEPCQPEQSINAIHAAELRMGQVCELPDLTPAVLRQFLTGFESRNERGKDGTPEIVEIVRGYLD